MNTEAITSRSVRSRILAIAVAFVLVFTCVCVFNAEPAYAASYKDKVTIYKGQSIKLAPVASNPISIKLSKSGIVTVKKTGKNKFTVTGKKAGTVVLTVSAKGYKAEKLQYTVKASWPSGSEKKPVTISTSKWSTVTSLDGKKKISIRATIWKDDPALDVIDEKQGGFTQADLDKINNAGYWTNNTPYLIKYEYKIGAGAGVANLYNLLDIGWHFNKSWKGLNSTQISKISLDPGSFNNNASSLGSGATGEIWIAYWVNNSVKELRIAGVGYPIQYQKKARFETKPVGYALSSCVRIVLPK